jgi:glycosyltransferase involved in cell wall biosynthesis
MSNNLSRQGISIFFPAFNDANSIGKIVTDAFEILPGLTDDFEVIVINDGSTDETAEVLRELGIKHQKLSIIQHESNKGYGGALRSGFGAATKDLVFYTDGDAQYDVRELPKLLALLDKKTDVVNGYKLERGDKINRKILGGFYNRLARFLFSLPIRDVDCDFRLIRREVLCKIELSSISGSICVELVYKLKKVGALFQEIGVNHYVRPFGQSQFFTFSRVTKTLIDFFFLWLNFIILRRD